MTKLDYTYFFESGIKLSVNWELFEQSFWYREETKDILELYYIWEERNSKTIWINWTSHSSKVVSLNAKNLKERATLIKKGIDWVVITNVDEIKEKISLILWVADCAPIVVSDKKGSTMALVHAWYAWTGKDIIWNLIKNLEKTNISLEDFEFYIWPMLWKNFEFSEKKYFEVFQKLCDKYWLHSWSYFIPTEQWKWYLDLRDLILDLLIENWIKHNQIKFSKIETNSPNNPWPSFRLHTKYKNIIEKFKNQDIEIKSELNFKEKENLLKYLKEENKLSEIEKELFLSEYFDRYKNDPRIWFFLEN